MTTVPLMAWISAGGNTKLSRVALHLLKSQAKGIICITELY